MSEDEFWQSTSAWENLVHYANSDAIYTKYLLDKDMKCSDFDMFCINHCRDIISVCNCIREIDKICKKNPENYKEIAEIIKKVFD